MVIAQLPSPPMPMCAVMGEDRKDGICSSHDLLARAVAVQYNSSIRETGSIMPSNELTEKKIAVLTNMLEDLHVLSRTLPSKRTIDLVQDVYQTFQSHFRAYLALYPSTSQDIRFHSIDTVDASSLVMKQAICHLHEM